MAGEGPDPDGSGPSSSSEVEALRRRLYAPGGASPAAVAEYERLMVSAPPAPAPPADAPAVRAAPPGAPPEVRRPTRRTLLVVGAVIVLAAVVAAGLVAQGRAALPERVAVPRLTGTTLLAYERPFDKNTHEGSITYQAEGFTLFRPEGRVVAVALRCVGSGRVVVSAGVPFDFRCDDRERRMAIRDTAGQRRPFYIVATTTGNVVWAARIVLLDPPQTGGAIPSFRFTCEGCVARSG